MHRWRSLVLRRHSCEAQKRNRLSSSLTSGPRRKLRAATNCLKISPPTVIRENRLVFLRDKGRHTTYKGYSVVPSQRFPHTQNARYRLFEGTVFEASENEVGLRGLSLDLRK